MRPLIFLTVCLMAFSAHAEVERISYRDYIEMYNQDPAAAQQYVMDLMEEKFAAFGWAWPCTTSQGESVTPDIYQKVFNQDAAMFQGYLSDTNVGPSSVAVMIRLSSFCGG